MVRCRDIYAMRGKLYLAFSENNLRWLLRCYLGMGNNVVEKGKREDRRGVGECLARGAAPIQWCVRS